MRIAFCFAISFFATPLFAQTIDVEASFDRWNYPFNASPGSRLSGSTFGAVFNPAFDDHDAQIIVGFDTAAAGVPTTNIELTSLTVTLTTATADAFEYDPTYDSFASYINPAADTDTGRPVELYGVGLRNGFVFPTFGPPAPGPIAFEEAEAFVFGNPAEEGVRNAFMTDGVAEGMGFRDVSNNVAEGFDLEPWAVGSIADLEAGATVPMNSIMSFEVDLTNPNVASYVNRGVSSGGLFFTIASMHTSTQGSQAGIPSFFLGDPNLPDVELAVAQVSIDYQVVPEPSAAFVLVSGLVGALFLRRRGRV